MKPWQKRQEASLHRGLRAGVIGVLDRQSMRFVEDNDHASSLHAAFGRLSVKDEDEHDATIDPSSVQYVGSYSWVSGSEKPTIMVPASPRILQTTPLPFSLQSDTELRQGRPGLDERQLSKLPLLPLFLAVDAYHDGNYDWSAIDIVTDRRVVRQLLRCLDSPKTDNFRINIQLAGNRTLLMRTQDPELNDRRVQPGSYGASFESSQTKMAPGCEETFGSHRRIVSYTFGALRMMVRFEADACIKDEHMLSSLPQSQDRKSNGGSRYSNLSPGVIRGGQLAPQTSIVELKSTTKQVKFADTFSQMFFSQTSHLVIGKHVSGTFHALERHALGKGVLAQAAARMQPSINRLAKLLGAIHNLAIQRAPAAPFALIWYGGVLTVREIADHPSELPEELLERFSHKHCNTGEE